MMPMAHMRGHREDAMKTYYTVALSMLAGVGVGAIAVQGLYAQSRPPVYLITELDFVGQGGLQTMAMRRSSRSVGTFEMVR